MNIHAALEGLVDRWQQWRDRAFRNSLRRRLRRDKTRYVGVAPSKDCIVHNERDITR